MSNIDSTPEPLGAPGTVAGLLSAGTAGPALLTADGEVLDHAGLVREVDRLAGQLRDAGLGPGDRIAVALPNGPEMALVLLAVMSVGCIAPLNPGYREDEFRFYLDDLGARALITFPGRPKAVFAALPDQTTPIELRGTSLSISFAAPSGPGARAGRPTPDDQALVLHTSGTTSRPKIVPLRHRNLTASARNIAESLRLTPADRSLNVMPLFHIHGIMAGLLAPLSVGGSVICTPGFDAFGFHRWVDELKPTYYSAVPTMHQMVLARAPEPRRSTLRFVRSSSASLPPPVFESLRRLFDVPVIEAYGMTEASHQMACNPFDRQKVGSVGLATGIEITILDPYNKVLPPGTKGEVAIKGPTVVDGYENNPSANESAFTDGWFRTGDEGMLDEEGYLSLTGRLKELINRGGEKISPLEIDAVLLEHPAVSQAVAFAIPHPKLGEEVGAAVVLAEAVSADAAQVDERELRAHVSGRLSAFKVPKRILFVPEIPKGPTGKVQRIGLAERLGLSEATFESAR
ncbi:MAG: AMP-binding protein [Acidimicrobiaceae bacterium]|nr:AMP-binding protein [Acidimicrobiaceae bacterium]